jgi:hypothetical protein
MGNLTPTLEHERYDMTDIAGRLRALAGIPHLNRDAQDLLNEAADENERLNNRIAELYRIQKNMFLSLRDGAWAR